MHEYQRSVYVSSSLSLMGEAARVYAEELSSLSLGVPLWFPEPTEAGEIQIGDVGFLEDGCFHRLFNITVPEEHPWNRLGVPDGFRPINIPPHLQHRAAPYLNSGVQSSRSLQTVTASPSIST